MAGNVGRHEPLVLCAALKFQIQVTVRRRPTPNQGSVSFSSMFEFCQSALVRIRTRRKVLDGAKDSPLSGLVGILSCELRSNVDLIVSQLARSVDFEAVENQTQITIPLGVG